MKKKPPMTEKKATIIIGLIGFSVLTILAVRSIIHQRKDQRILEQDFRYVIGTIVETNFEMKSATNNAEYTFYYAGVLRNGEDEYLKSRNKLVNRGSRFFVKVSVIDPSIHYMLFDSIPPDNFVEYEGRPLKYDPYLDKYEQIDSPVVVQPDSGWREIPKLLRNRD